MSVAPVVRCQAPACPRQGVAEAEQVWRAAKEQFERALV